MEPGSSAQEDPEGPQSDFALIFDWMDPPRFLELGEQQGDYPFGVDLFLQGPDTVLTGDNGETVHTLGDLSEDHFRLSYSEYEDSGSTYRDITLLECDGSKEISTPRGIHIGSTRAEVVTAYGTDLVYCLKEEGDDILVPHDYYYAYQTEAAPTYALCLFLKDGLVAGIRMENVMDMGLDAYAVNNTSIFPIQRNGDPDYSNRQDIYQEPVDATRQVYIAWNQLVTNQNLSAEERYGYRRDVFTNLPEMNWQELTQLGGSSDPVTAEAFADWLRDQESFSEGEIYYIQRGSMDTGLDGFYAENYCSVLAAALAYDPVAFARQLAYNGSGTDESQLRAHVLTDTAYPRPGQRRRGEAGRRHRYQRPDGGGERLGQAPALLPGESQRRRLLRLPQDPGRAPSLTKKRKAPRLSAFSYTFPHLSLASPGKERYNRAKKIIGRDRYERVP